MADNPSVTIPLLADWRQLFYDLKIIHLEAFRVSVESYVAQKRSSRCLYKPSALGTTQHLLPHNHLHVHFIVPAAAFHRALCQVLARSQRRIYSEILYSLLEAY